MITCLIAPAEMGGDHAEIVGDRYRHLFRARRLAVGETVRVVDGLGGARWARIAAVERDRASLSLAEKAPDHEPGLRLEILLATPRPERASWLVEKATELGVSALRFLDTERCARTINARRLERLSRVAVAALGQCHGSRLPTLSGPHAWSEIPDLLASGGASYVLDPAGTPWRARRPSEATGEIDVILLIGPEGGWSPRELSQLAELNTSLLSLGQRVLRVETAALIAASHCLLG